ncbi:MAG: N-acetyl-gamma-glutamyl-phosphate reductase [Oscillospiraceae bacterium]|nr:N-acetyl-gamma-glutamyl-phosphate reductase [Oscillospiraceae bacterium]MDD6086003.1 N-acetyl-gamma-glutamyl-phosphate reductase [Oscillospiraceae bacterium]MDY3258155.1 N-acetyl-gamma-glutamyl-phosphate reductase [Ruminococcus callidus]
MKPKIYIDGQAGTTGLKIRERFAGRDDIEILMIDEAKRKDPEERKKMINSSDFTFLCLPDAASIEAVSMIENPNVRIIDASTAHRTNPEWAYGFPELSENHRKKIVDSKRVAVPGCYASGFISLVYPMVSSGIMPADYPVTSFAVSGYSGGGNKMIAQYESDEKPETFNSPRFYGLAQTHKHLPEMQKITGLAEKPIFTPIVDDYYSGMVVCVPFRTRLADKKVTVSDVYEMFAKHYDGQNFVKVMPWKDIEEQKKVLLSSNDLSGTNKMEIHIFGDDERIMLCSRLDNLGKGASGAAVQCLNIMMGIDETTGLL